MCVNSDYKDLIMNVFNLSDTWYMYDSINLEYIFEFHNYLCLIE